MGWPFSPILALNDIAPGSEGPALLGLLHGIADLGIACCYLAMAGLLIWLTRRREVPFPRVFQLFAAFLCGCTAIHSLEVLSRWYAVEAWLVAATLLTALVAIAAAMALIRMMPQALVLPNLVDLNRELQNEIADRERLEEELREHAANLRYLNVELEVAKAASDAASRSKSEFLANMSHELRTPLTAILGFTDVLLGNLEREDNLDACRTIRRNGEHLLALLNDILDLSKIEAGKMQVEQLSCAPHEILDDVLTLMRVRTDAKGLSLRVRYDGAVPQRIVTDPTRWRQILVNLVGNAVKFTEVGGIELVARLRADDPVKPQIEVAVVDTGIGIGPDKLGQLFQPFTQADASTSRRFGGTGLGLTISRRLAELLGGGIEAQSTLGQGSCFTVRIETGSLAGVPLVDPQQTARDSLVSAPKAPAQAAIRLPIRVLLVEDGPDNQRLIAFLLKKAGAEVVVAANGAEGVEKAMACRDGWGRRRSDHPTSFAVILMDMQMPIMDGYQATAKLRELGYTGPIIALTAHAMPQDRQRCLDAGCDDYATKPIDKQALLGLVARYAAPAIAEHQAPCDSAAQ